MVKTHWRRQSPEHFYTPRHGLLRRAVKRHPFAVTTAALLFLAYGGIELKERLTAAGGGGQESARQAQGLAQGQSQSLGQDKNLNLALPAPASSLSLGACGGVMAGGKPPRSDTGALGEDSPLRVVCHKFYAAGFDGAIHESRWAAEKLTAASVLSARALHGRPKKFHDDPLLPQDSQYHTEDYRLLNYARGHLAPSGDMPDWQARQESFSMANVIPQDSDLNSGAWNRLEMKTRALALNLAAGASLASAPGSGSNTKEERALYVVTGTGFKDLKSLNNPNKESPQARVAGQRHMLVPDYIWKGIWAPGASGPLGKPHFVLCENAAHARCQKASMARIWEISGVVAFPAAGEE